jgi:hypothetical protein
MSFRERDGHVPQISDLLALESVEVGLDSLGGVLEVLGGEMKGVLELNKMKNHPAKQYVMREGGSTICTVQLIHTEEITLAERTDNEPERSYLESSRCLSASSLPDRRRSSPSTNDPTRSRSRILHSHCYYYPPSYWVPPDCP